MSAVLFFYGNEHITLRSAGVGPIDLFQDHNVISHTVVRKLNPEVGPVDIPSLSSCHWAPEARECLQEGNLIGLSLPQRWGLKSPMIPPANAVLYLNMCYQITHQHTYSALRSLHPRLQSLLVGGTNPCNLQCVRQLRKYDRDVTGPVGHAHCLPHVCT